MNRALPLALLALLAACGIDGAPTPPASDTEAPASPGLTVTGDAQFGIAGGSAAGN